MSQWQIICLPTQGKQVQFLVQEDPTCRGATKPMHHNYWSPRPRAHASPQKEATAWEACALQLESSPRSLHLEQAYGQQQRASTAKNKCNFLKRRRAWR